VADYKVYCLDLAGKISSVPDWIEADTDKEAFELARRLHENVQCEIWQGSRFVGSTLPQSSS
jgi:hypothetical protein